MCRVSSVSSVQLPPTNNQQILVGLEDNLHPKLTFNFRLFQTCDRAVDKQTMPDEMQLGQNQAIGHL